MTPEFHIITQRLQLRLISIDDAGELVQSIRQSPSLHQWIDWCHARFSLQDAESFIQATRLNWIKAEAYGFGIFERETDALVGMVAINEFYHTFNMASLGYWITDEYQRRGYAQEALHSLITFCFKNLELTRLEIVCDPDNLPSQTLALRCGAIREQLAPNRFLYAGEPKAGIIFSLIP